MNRQQDIIFQKAGIGLRAPHHQAILMQRPAVGFLEAHPENYMGGGAARHALKAARNTYPISLHGVGLSLGGAEPLDITHLERLAELTSAIDPILISEHVAWCRQGGTYLNDLLPMPYTEESLQILCGHVDQVQNRLRRQILLENPSSYVAFTHSPIPEGAFMAELARRTGCGLLLDVNNLHVNAHNLGSDPLETITALELESVKEIHVAGHHIASHQDVTILIDDHGSTVAAPVWELYRQAVRRFPRTCTLVEWDSHLPPLPVLVAEAATADNVRSLTLSECCHDLAG